MAILALCIEGHGDHPRVNEGIRLILDRALDQGGWNLAGNKAVFGREAPPVAGSHRHSAGGPGGSRRSLTRDHARALDYLLATLPSVRAPVSLGWGVLALRAHARCPAHADSWLAEAFETCQQRQESTMNLALLLLAACADGSCFITPTISSGHSQ